MNPHSITPLESKYENSSREVSDIFSDYNFTKTRTEIEIEYYKLICQLNFKQPSNDILNFSFDYKAYKYIKIIEKTTKHDVKAIEYFLKNLIVDDTKEYIHFGLTSQDINSLSYSMMLNKYTDKFTSKYLEISGELVQLANKSKVLFCARTHGQAAVPTSFDKELYMFHDNLNQIHGNIFDNTLTCKFGGANGDLLAHKFADPHNWHDEMDSFIKEISKWYEIKRTKTTSQVDNNIELANLFSYFINFNNQLIKLSRDIWMYNSLGLLKQTNEEGQIGSSVMPQKINPINFENAEGNLEYANCQLDFMKNKLTITRMQRDLSDSTVMRNIGIPLAHMFVAFDSIITGLKKIEIDPDNCKRDLEKNWSCVTEGVQSLLRINFIENAYEKVKDCINKSDSYKEFCDKILEYEDIAKLDSKILTKIKDLTPETYYYGPEINL